MKLANEKIHSESRGFLQESNVTSTKYVVIPVLAGGQILALHPFLGAWQVLMVRMVTPVAWVKSSNEKKPVFFLGGGMTFPTQL